jgi:hypothetical protein
MKIKFFRSQLQTDSIPVTSDPKGTLAPVEDNYGLYLPAELHSTSLDKRSDYIGIKPDYFIDFKKSNYIDEVLTILSKTR